MFNPILLQNRERERAAWPKPASPSFARSTSFAFQECTIARVSPTPAPRPLRERADVSEANAGCASTTSSHPAHHLYAHPHREHRSTTHHAKLTPPRLRRRRKTY